MGLGLVDCVSHELMRDLGITFAFTFDPHHRK
jgi:predicted nucleic acid-binding protein